MGGREGLYDARDARGQGRGCVPGVYRAKGSGLADRYFSVPLLPASRSIRTRKPKPWRFLRWIRPRVRGKHSLANVDIERGAYDDHRENENDLLLPVLRQRSSEAR